MESSMIARMILSVRRSPYPATTINNNRYRSAVALGDILGNNVLLWSRLVERGKLMTNHRTLLEVTCVLPSQTALA